MILLLFYKLSVIKKLSFNFGIIILKQIITGFIKLNG